MIQNGGLIEFDTPEVLLETDSAFRELVSYKYLEMAAESKKNLSKEFGGEGHVESIYV
jgi:hypothetical protein